MELKLVSILLPDFHALVKLGVLVVNSAAITQLENFVTRTPNFNILEGGHYKSHGTTITEPLVKQFTVMNLF